MKGKYVFAQRRHSYYGLYAFVKHVGLAKKRREMGHKARTEHFATGISLSDTEKGAMTPKKEKILRVL
jgi:hypothetical protein